MGEQEREAKRVEASARRSQRARVASRRAIKAEENSADILEDSD